MRRLPAVVEALTSEVTRLTDEKPVDAIHAPCVLTAAPAQSSRLVGFDEAHLPSDVLVRYLYTPGELEGGERRRARIRSGLLVEPETIIIESSQACSA